jgi:hypothetical protein
LEYIRRHSSNIMRRQRILILDTNYSQKNKISFGKEYCHQTLPPSEQKNLSRPRNLHMPCAVDRKTVIPKITRTLYIQRDNPKPSITVQIKIDYTSSTQHSSRSPCVRALASVVSLSSALLVLPVPAKE